MACKDNRCKHRSEKAVAGRKKAGETDGESVDLSKEDRARGSKWENAERRKKWSKRKMED